MCRITIDVTEYPELRIRIETEAARLETAGASIARRIDEPDKFWIIMRDVEENEFCVI